MSEEYDIYDEFASLYDEFMDNIPYDRWAEYLHGLLADYGVNEGIVLDLACGTGEITRRLRSFGYDMIGLDMSEAMLSEAQEKCPDVLFLHQDMREMELYGTVKACVCICDGMNYLCSTEDFVNVLKKVNNYLDKDGIFIFDLKTHFFFKERLGNRTIVDNREDATVIWENEYDEKSRMNRYLLTTYREDPEKPDLFFRGDEIHVQRAYSGEEIKKAASDAGMKFISSFNAFTGDAPSSESERVYVVLGEGFQEGKYYGD